MARKSAGERRRELVEAGLRVIAREGMHGATVRAIVAEAGLPLATFHYVFDSRDEMIGEAYAYVVLPELAPQELRLPSGRTLVDAVREVLQDWVDRFLAHAEYELAVMEIMAHCKRTPALAHLPGQVQERYVEHVSALVEAICARSGVRLARPLDEIATMVLHVTDGLTYHLLRTGDEAAARRYIAEATPMLADAMLHEAAPGGTAPASTAPASAAQQLAQQGAA